MLELWPAIGLPYYFGVHDFVTNTKDNECQDEPDKQAQESHPNFFDAEAVGGLEDPTGNFIKKHQKEKNKVKKAKIILKKKGGKNG